MSNSTLIIRGKEYKLDEVLLHIRLSQENGTRFLTFDLFADSQDLSKAGFAINSLTIPGNTVVDIENAIFELDEDDSDKFNELRESVMCEPGLVLELSYLKISFNTIQGGFVDTTLEAKYFRRDEEASKRIEEGIRVTGNFPARARA